MERKTRDEVVSIGPILPQGVYLVEALRVTTIPVKVRIDSACVVLATLPLMKRAHPTAHRIVAPNGDVSPSTLEGVLIVTLTPLNED